MTDKITVPRETWDAMREALESVGKAIPAGQSTVKTCYAINNMHRDAVQAALTAANAVSHPKPETAPVTEGLAITSAANAVSEQPKPVALQWVAEMIMSDCGCSTNNERLLERVIGRIEQYERANGLANPQATEPAGKTRDPLDLGQYVNEANISANDKPVAVIEKLQAVINVKKGF